MHKLAAILSLVVGISLTGCGLTEETPHRTEVSAAGITDEPASNLVSFANTYPEEVCKINARCDMAMFSSDIAQCLEEFPMPLPDSPALSFDKAAAKSCLEFLRNIDCADSNLVAQRDPSLLVERCGRVIQGTVPVGEQCYGFFECVDGSACSLRGCPGVCVATRMSTCGVCGADEYCDPVGSVCMPSLSVGETCASRSECQYGLRCYEGVCVVGGTDGQSCDPAPCAEGWTCVEGANRTCEKFVFGRQEGETCGGVYLCGNDLRCDSITWTCVATTPAPKHEPITCTRVVP